MSKIYNILIIEDHQIVVDTYKKALSCVTKNILNIDFSIVEAKDCDMAYKEIITASEKQNIDLIFLDIQLPPCSNNKLYSGQDLGDKIKELLPKAKIIICTSINDRFRLNSIFKTINPESFLIKSDIVFNDLIKAIEAVMLNECFYSLTILDLMKKRITNTINIDKSDVLLLYEMSNGAKMKELLNIIPLTKSGIEKRKRLLKEKFKIKSNSDRDLIIEAKKKGYI